MGGSKFFVLAAFLAMATTVAAGFVDGDAAAASAVSAAETAATMAELMKTADVSTCQQQIQVLEQTRADLMAHHDKFAAALSSPEEAAKMLKQVQQGIDALKTRVGRAKKQKESVLDLMSLNAKIDTSQQEKLQNVLDKLRSDKGIFLGVYACVLGVCVCFLRGTCPRSFVAAFGALPTPPSGIETRFSTGVCCRLLCNIQYSWLVNTS